MKKFNDPVYVKFMRSEFKKLKRTPEFFKWRKTQLVYIQKRQCAWCRRKISKGSKNIHVVHAFPIDCGGTNSFDNLVISHIMCDAKKIFGLGQVPQWILKNRREYELNALRREQQRVFDECVERHEQEKLANRISKII